MHWDIRNLTTRFKDAIMTFFTTYDPASCDKICRSELTPDPLLWF